MEFSISGPGLRPTLNAYLYGDAMAISRMAERAGRKQLSVAFRQKAETIREAMDRHQVIEHPCLEEILETEAKTYEWMESRWSV